MAVLVLKLCMLSQISSVNYQIHFSPQTFFFNSTWSPPATQVIADRKNNIRTKTSSMAD
jgi:hypothetical protein